MPSPPASPARPILASTLLSSEKNRFSKTQHQWKTGIQSLDNVLPPNLWASGKVIGVIDDSDSYNDDISLRVEKQKPPVITQLIITHLASIHKFSANILPSPDSSSPPETVSTATVFLITSATTPTGSSSAISPTTLATALESASLPPSLLDSVSLLQYFDFPGLADAVAEVSATLFQRQHHDQAQNRHQQPQHPRPDGTSDQSQPQPANPSILILGGLTQTLTTLTRSHGPTATNALLASLLRSLTHLSRTQPDLLIMLLLEEEFLDFPPSSHGGSGATEELSAFSSYSEQRRERRRLRDREQGQGGFGGLTAKSGSALASVMAVLASGIDVLVLVHTLPEEKRDVVEVLLDRVGDGTGRWGVR